MFVLFVFFLLGISYEIINQVYILLKHSVASADVFLIVFYGVELAALFTAVGALFKLVRNVEKKVIFDYKNVRLLQMVTIALFAPIIVDFLGRILGLCEKSLLTGDMKVWIAGALFVVVISEVFKRGIELKKEQELVI